MADDFLANQVSVWVMSDGYPIGDFSVFGWSISGNETAIGVRRDRILFMFDVGIAPTWSIKAEHVFIRYVDPVIDYQR